MKKILLASVIGCLGLLWCLGCETGEDLENGLDEDLSDRATSVGLYQAENFTAQSGCKMATNQAGYTGAGFMDYGSSGTWIEFNNVTAAQAGSHTLEFRYATAAGSRQCAIMINGTNVGNVAFSATGSWTKWGTATLTKDLKAGKNTIRILANTSSGGPNLDSLEVLSNIVGTNSCVEAAEAKTAVLSCPTGQTIASVNFASYGLPTGSCPGGFATSACHAASSLDKVKASCLNKSSCSVAASNGVFGDPCAGKPKKLAIVYTCSGGGPVDNCPSDPNKTEPGVCGCGVPEGTCSASFCVEAAENKTAALSCPSGKTIVTVNFASYGLPTGSCPGGFAIGTCHAASSPDNVKISCLNRPSCSVAASNGVFGDPCAGTPKKLAVVYTCSGGGPIDNCPNDPNKTEPGLCGCGVPENSCSGGITQQGLEYYGTNWPSYFTPIPNDYKLFDTNILFQGGLDGLGHAGTAPQGAGKFVFNRIYRASKHGVTYGEQYGIFHWWLGSYGSNSIEGGIWVNPYVAGPHYYPTLHIAGVGDQYHTCSDVQFGSGMGGSFLGDKWLTEIQISNRVLTVPGVNVAFDKDQPPHEADNGIWIGWGWTYLNLDHPRGFKFWMSMVESYDYQGPVNGYMPEYFNWVDPKKIADGSYAARRASNKPFGTFATLGSRPDGGIANEQYTRGLLLKDDIYYVPMPRVPSYKTREYVIANIQSIESQDMENYSSALRSNATFDSLIPTQFLPFNGVSSSTHSQLKVSEKINGQEHLTVMRPPYSIGYDTYNGFVEWPVSSPVANQARGDQNGYLHYRKSSAKWPVEAGASDSLKNHPNLYKSELISPPDNVSRVPRVNSTFFSYKERDTKHPDFANWDITGKQRYKTLLQNGSTATYVWFKFIEQPAVKTAKQNWPSVYTDAYLARLQTYIENLHRKIAQRSKANPSDPVFINYRNSNNHQQFNPHLAKIDPGQLVEPPAGFKIGYVPVIISVYHPAAYSNNGTGLVSAPASQCLNSAWTRTYFPDIP